MGGKRGRLITTEERITAVQLISEACTAGARKYKACELLEITIRTLERWEQEDGIKLSSPSARNFSCNL